MSFITKEKQTNKYFEAIKLVHVAFQKATCTGIYNCLSVRPMKFKEFARPIAFEGQFTTCRECCSNN